MQITFLNHQDILLAQITSDKILVNNAQDAVELIANCGYNGSDKIIVREHHLHPDFFDLKNGIAGDILQKFSTYRAQLAIIGSFSENKSKSLQDFIRESNKAGRIGFVSSVEEAITFLTR